MKQFILEKSGKIGFNIAKFPKVLQQNKECSLSKINNKKFLYKDVSGTNTKDYCGTSVADLSSNYILLNIPKIKANSNEKEVIKVTPIINWYNFLVKEKIEENALDVIEKNLIEEKKRNADLNKIPINTKNKKSKQDIEADMQADMVKANLSTKQNKLPDHIKSILNSGVNLELKEPNDVENDKVKEKKNEENDIFKPKKKKPKKKNDDSVSNRSSINEDELSFDGNKDLKDAMINNKKAVYVTVLKDDFLNNEDNKSNYSDSKLSSESDSKNDKDVDTISSDYYSDDDFDDENSNKNNFLGNKRENTTVSLKDALNQIFSLNNKISRTRLKEELDKISISMKELQNLESILEKEYRQMKSSGDIIYFKKN